MLIRCQDEKDSIVEVPGDTLEGADLSGLSLHRAMLEKARRVRARRFESFRPDSETRYFVVRGKAHAPSGEVPALVKAIAPRISSSFFAVDVAIREDGAPGIVELGDGQVSDLVGWRADAFGRLWL